MNIGIFTDTYFPQISGVATSIQTLKNGLESQGNNVFIFTTTDPHLEKGTVQPNVFRFGSIPFISFTDRRIAMRGLFEAAKVAKEVKLDVVHTQTEFSMGMIGKYVASQLKIPAVHTYHTMYEDYLHYVLNGHLLKPVHVKQFTKVYLHSMDGVIAPSERVEALLTRYGVKIPMRVIPTGVDLAGITQTPARDVRQELGIDADTPVLLTLSRIASEKKIDHILRLMPFILNEFPKTKFVIAGDGPDLQDLKDQVARLTLEDSVLFVGNIAHEDVANYYRMADLFVSASDTETQGLTYIEALSQGTKCVVFETSYTRSIFDDEAYGHVFQTQDQMLQAILAELRQGTPRIPDEKLKTKMAQISPEAFAQDVQSFYQAVIENYKETEVSND